MNNSIYSQNLLKSQADFSIPLTQRGRAESHIVGQFIRDYYARIFEEDEEKGYANSCYHEERQPKRHVRMWVSPYLRARQTGDCIMEVASDFVKDRYRL